MTCIIGLVQDGNVYIGGDRAAVDGWKNYTSVHAKVFRIGEILLGWCGSHRMAQIIEHEFSPSRPQSATETDLHYLVVTFASELRTLLTSRGIIGKSDDHEDKFEGAGLFGYRGHLYRISNNFQIDHFERDYDSIGSGSPFALGAMQVMVGGTPEFKIRTALEAAAVLCCDVKPPFDIEVLDGGKEKSEDNALKQHFEELLGIKQPIAPPDSPGYIGL